MALEAKRQLLISRGWVQAVAIVMIFGFTVMGMLLAYRTYTGEPPIPARVTDCAAARLWALILILVITTRAGRNAACRTPLNRWDLGPGSSYDPAGLVGCVRVCTRFFS